MTTTTTAKPASDRQRAYLTSLLADKDLTGTAYPAWDEGVVANVTSREASNAIGDLLRLRRKPATTAVTPAATTAEITVGMYLVGTDIETGRVFRVVAAQSTGNLYAKELVRSSGEETDGEYVTGTFEYVPGAMNIIRRQGRRMTVEEGAAFGHLFHFCCCCGQELTAAESIAAGIGPICASKYF